MTQTIKLGLLAVGLVSLGAACSAKTTVTTGNTNTTVSTTVNTSLTNSSTTGTFSTNASTTSQVSAVSLTSQGPQPKSLTVTSGTTVVFTNNDSVGHQVASNPHPSHTDLPGFDSLSSIRAGGTFSFTFVKTETFGYHDHADPFNSKYFGTIIVQ